MSIISGFKMRFDIIECLYLTNTLIFCTIMALA